MCLKFLIFRFFLCIFQNHLSNALNEAVEPRLEQMTSSGDEIVFQCKISNINVTTKVHFHCIYNNVEPPYDRCYENCDTISEKVIDIKCSKEIDEVNVIFKYISKKSTLPTGTYYCSYKSEKSHKINHVQEERINVTETSETTTTKKPISTAIIPTKPTISERNFSLQISRKEIVYLLLALLTFSLILNVIFFIRCLITRHIINNNSTMTFSPTDKSLAACLCFERNENGFVFNNYHKGREDIYDNIRDMPPDSDTTKSKSSSGHESQNVLISPTSSQLTRSSTFPFRQSVLVHTPTDQMAMTPLNMQPYMMPYILEDGQCVMAPVLSHRLSVHGLYDDVAADPASNMPIRSFASTGSLNHRPKRFPSSQTKASPLPEENQSTSPPFTNLNSQTDEGIGFTTNDMSSTYDLNSSEGTYISGKESDSYRDPVRSAKLEMSREMMAKADTLLREAHNLLK